jgi:glycosyltransferase involved in cell wall biosynthesis
MKIVIITNLFPPEFIGGYELLILEIAAMLSKKGHDIVVATTPLINHHENNTSTEYQVRRILHNTGLSLDPPDGSRLLKRTYIDMSNIAAIRNLLEEVQPDRIMLGNIDGIGGLGIICYLHECGYKTVLYLADNPFQEITQTNEIWECFNKLYRADRALQNLAIIALSEGIVQETVHTLSSKLGREHYIPGTVRAEEETINESTKNTAITRFVFSSRVAPHKGIHIMLEAAKKLVELGETDFQIDVFGGGNIPDLIQKAHAFGLKEQVKYVGLVERLEMIERYREYDGLLFPTWMREPLGLVAIEAAAKGCIPIITAQTGAAEWLHTSDCIKIERTAEGLAGGMQRVMYMTPDERQSMGNNLKKNIKKYFAEDRWHPRIEEVLMNQRQPNKKVNLRAVEDAFFAILRMWRG